MVIDIGKRLSIEKASTIRQHIVFDGCCVQNVSRPSIEGTLWLVNVGRLTIEGTLWLVNVGRLSIEGTLWLVLVCDIVISSSVAQA